MSSSNVIITGILLTILCFMIDEHETSDRTDEKFLYPVRTLLGTDTNETVVEELLKRLIPNQASSFHLKIDRFIGPIGKDTFNLETSESFIKITGTSAIALSLGVNHYLKYFCQAHVSWTGDQLNLPNPLPVVKTAFKITTNDGFRYYQNVCTVSYSMVWWDWTRWEREIDWMALNGINLPLAFTAQEAIWYKVFTKLGFNDTQINDFFTGPAFLAWNRMGNFQGFGGPLSMKWHQKRIALQHRILNRMRQFGMIPVLPAFAGRVPPSFLTIFPNATVIKQTDHWGHFEEPYCCTSFLEPQDPLFITIGSMFLQEYIEEFGSDHVYNTDLFNEMSPFSSDPAYLEKCGQAVFKSMTAVDPDAIWLMQGWIFVNSPDFWKPPQTKALLTSVPIGRMIILDLEAEFFPQYSLYESFYGQPFIWCMLHNFGGVLGLYGAFDYVNKGTFPARTYPNSSMIGTGLSPEGIEKNDVMYEFMNEMAWRKEPLDLDSWLNEFATRRYGKYNKNITQAWLLLKRSVYNATSVNINHGMYTIVSRPKLNKVPLVWYDMADVVNALNLFQTAGSDVNISQQETYKYDFIDISRQAMQLAFDSQYLKLVTAFKTKNITNFRIISNTMLEILDDLDLLLSADEHFLLGKWVASAKNWASSAEEELLFEYNARNQISLWGPTGQIIDYANKQWSGVVSGYYKPRWELFVNVLQDSLTKRRPFKQESFNKIVLWFAEEPFSYSTTELQTRASDNPVELVNGILKKYETILNNLKSEDLRSAFNKAAKVKRNFSGSGSFRGFSCQNN